MTVAALQSCSQDRICTALFYTPTIIMYMTTLRLVDGFAKRNKINLHPPLMDLGFNLFPRLNFCVWICDGIGVFFTFFLFRWVFFIGPGLERTTACEALLLAGLGNVISTTLHSVTVLPSDRFQTSGKKSHLFPFSTDSQFIHNHLPHMLSNQVSVKSAEAILTN